MTSTRTIGWANLAAFLAAGTLIFVCNADVAAAARSDGGTPASAQLPPLRTIASLNLDAGTNALFPVRIVGTVVDQRPGEYIVISDSTGTIFADSHSAATLKIKGAVEVIGTPVWEGSRFRLKDTAVSFADKTNSSGAGESVLTRPAALPLLTKAWQVRDLPAEKAAWKYPVQLSGVVTYFAKDQRFTLQDDISGISVQFEKTRTNFNLEVGEFVDVEGWSDPGGYAPVVIASNVVSRGMVPLPEPRQATVYQLNNDQEGSQWLELTGIVHSESFTNGRLVLTVSDPTGRITVYVNASSNAPSLLDAVVRIRGISSTIANNRRQFLGLVIQSPSLAFIQVEEPAVANPFDLPPKSILSLTQFRPRLTLERRVNVSGIVTLCRPGQWLYLQDATDGLQVFTSQTDGIQPGTRVKVAGYPALGSYGTVLRDAICRAAGKNSLPPADSLSESKPLNPQLHGRWVQADAHLLDHSRVGNMEVLKLQIGSRVIEANCLTPSDALKSIRVGSLVRVTGIYTILADESRTPVSCQMLVPSAAQVVVLQAPSRWTSRHTFFALGGMGLIITTITLWVIMLRRRVREQTASLQDSEMKFRSLVEQSLVGVYIIQDGRFAYANPRYCEFFGYTTEGLESLAVDATILSDDRAMVAEQLRRRVDGTVNAAHYSFRGVRKDGSIIDLEVLGTRTTYKGKPAVLGTCLDITEKKKAEAALEEASSLLETLLANSPDCIYFKDRESRFVRTSASMAKLFRVASPQELLGKTDFDFFLSAHARAAFEDEQRIMSTGEPMIGKPEQETHPDGRVSWALTTKLPWRDKSGNIIGTFGISKDVTALKEAERRLAHEQGLFTALVENLPDAIYFKDRASRFVRMSKSKAERSRLALIKKFQAEHPDGKLPDYLADPEQCAGHLVGKSDFDIYPEDRARIAYEEEQNILRTEQPLIGHIEKYIRPGEKALWFHTTKMPWRNEDGEIIGTFGVTRDITTIKEFEAVLDYERELFRTLLDNFPDAIYFKDLESRFVRVSRSEAENAFKVCRAAHDTQHPNDPLPDYLSDFDTFNQYLVGKSDFDIHSDERARVAFEDEQNIIRTGQPLLAKIERDCALDGKTTWCISTKMPWRNKEGQIIGTFGVSKDITAVKEAEAQLETAHQRLVETSRLAGMAEVATDVLHNVGNVLNSVNISCSLTIDRIRTSKMTSLSKVSALIDENRSRLGEFFTHDPRGQQLPDYLKALADHLQGDQALLLKELEQLLKHIDHIKQIVVMQQSYAKVAGVKETISAKQLVDDALHINAAALVRHDVHVKCDIQETPPISTEKHKVLQILVNLIRNAKYAMDDGKRADKLLTVRVAPEGNWVKIEVIDNGVGIPQDNLTRIFGHGFTTRRNGHGFGLHSSAIAVKELGGSLTAHSAGTGAGATFTLLLPLTPVNQLEPQRYEPAEI